MSDQFSMVDFANKLLWLMAGSQARHDPEKWNDETRREYEAYLDRTEKNNESQQSD